MNRLLSLLILPIVALVTSSCSSDTETDLKDARLFELRVYHPQPGKLEALHERFRAHTLEFFEKHGMENIGYWTTTDEDPVLVYLLAFPDAETQKQAWEGFNSDPEWRAVFDASRVKGPLVSRVDSTLLRTTDYSPALEQTAAEPERFFELRTYKTTSGNLDNLDDRFREATMELFEKHGGANLVYFHLAEGEEGAEDTLIYLMAYESPEVREAMFKNFRADPVWQAALAASEENAGGPLTQPNGVTSRFLVPTDYSKIR